MNIHVNLLPEARILKLKIQARKRFITTLVGLIGGVIVAIIVVLVMLQVFLISTSQINQNNINRLKAEVDKTRDMEQETATLQEHLASFVQLNTNRLFASKIFTNLSNTIPARVTVNSFQISDDDVVTISGTAKSFAEVASFQKALEEYNVNFKPQKDLERKPVFTNVNITSITKDVNSDQVNFSMTFKADTTLLKKQTSET